MYEDIIKIFGAYAVKYMLSISHCESIKDNLLFLINRNIRTGMAEKSVNHDKTVLTET